MTAIEPAAYNLKQTVTTTGGTGNTAVYHIGIGGDASMIHGCHLLWDSSLVATVTVWTSSFTDTDAPLTATTPTGVWVQQLPPTGYTAIYPTAAASAATPFNISIPGGTAGGADLSWGNLGSKRVKLIVTVATNGQLWVRSHGKM